jgi:hypothetical protein
MPAGAKLTANALAKHWARCAQPQAPARPAIAAPPPNWRARLDEIAPDNRINAENRGWDQLPADFRARIIESASASIKGSLENFSGPPEMPG